MTVVEQIRQNLASLHPESLEIVDESAKHAGHEGAKGGGGHYQIAIVSRRFAGQPVQSRHRMIYQALAPMMKKNIHALAIKACAPGEHQSSQHSETRKDHP